MLSFLLLTQTASVDTSGLFAIANHGQVLLVRRVEALFAIIPAEHAAKGKMPSRWQRLPKPLLGAMPYRSGFMVYEEKGDLLLVQGQKPPTKLAGPIPKTMPQLPLQWFGLDRRSRPYLYVNRGGDTTLSGLVILEHGKWLVYKGDPMPIPKSFSARMYGENSVGRTDKGLWFPNVRNRAYFVPNEKLGGAHGAVEISTTDPSLRAYAVRTNDFTHYVLVTIRGSRILLGRFRGDTYLDPRRCFLASDDRFVDYQYGDHGDRMIVSRVRR